MQLEFWKQLKKKIYIIFKEKILQSDESIQLYGNFIKRITVFLQIRRLNPEFQSYLCSEREHLTSLHTLELRAKDTCLYKNI